MTGEKEKYNHNEMVEWLKKKCPHDATPYKSFEDIPKKELAKGIGEAKFRKKILQGKLPIDLRYAVDFIYVEKRFEEEEKEIDTKEVKETQEYSYYTIFLVSTSEISDEISDEKFGKIIDSFRERWLFYQFYFTSIAEPKGLEIIVVVPHYIGIPPEAIKEFFEKYKFGLWKIDIKKDKLEKLVPAKNLRKRMTEEFEKSVDEPENVGNIIKEIFEEISKKEVIDESFLKAAIKEKAEDFARFFENYILDAVEAISGIKPTQIGKRYIDKNLMDLVFNLKKVSYSDELRKLVNEHLDKKEDDYLFSRESFKSLWESNFDGIEYPKTFESFEKFLQHFFPTYREHFIHQFQVFLLGTIILDHLLQNRKFLEDAKINRDSLVKGWILASSIHDFTYPLQKYDEWSSGFLREQLKIDEPLSFLELKGIYVEKTFLTRVEHILSELEKDLIRASGYERTILYNEIRRFFYYEIAEKKNHGLMSGSYILKRFKEKDGEEFSKVVLPAAVASAIHDDEIWQILSGQVDGDIEKKWEYIAKLLKIEKNEKIAKILKNSDLDDEEKDRKIAIILREKKEWTGNIYADISNIIMKKPLSKLSFRSQPLTFLLILCDNLQDCGRPCEDEERRKEMEAADVRLRGIIVNSSTITIQLFFNDTRESRGFMTDKEKILGKLEKWLRSPDIGFVIEYWDREKNELTNYNFKIGGNS